MSDIEYKKLLAEILGRVDEKINISMTKLKDRSKFKTPVGKDTKRGKELNKYASQVADNTPDNNRISDEDFYNAYVGDDAGEKLAADEISNYLVQPDDKKDVQNAKDLAALAKKSGNTTPLDSELDTALSPSNTGAYISGSLDAQGKPRSGRDLSADAFALPDLSRGSYSDSSANVWTDFNKFKISADSSVINQFNVIEGKDLVTKFKSLLEFGEALKNKQSVNDWIAKNQPDGQFKFMSYASAFITLADMGKVLSGNEAGYAFEKYLALMLGSPVIGGDNGAVDNITNISGGNPAYLSAKMYNTKGSIKQALGKPKSEGGTGMQALLKDSGEKIYFISIIKGTDVTNTSSGDGSYSTLYIYLTETGWDDTIGYYGRNVTVNNNQASFSKPYKLKIKDGSAYLFAGDGADLSKPADAAFKIPVLFVKDADKMSQLTAQSVAKVVDSSTQQTIDKIQTIYKRLVNLKMNTRDYVSDKGKTATVGDAQEFVSAIVSDYGNLKGEYNEMFKAGGSTKDEITERMNIEEIAELTKNILKEMLDDE